MIRKVWRSNYYIKLAVVLVVAWFVLSIALSALILSPPKVFIRSRQLATEYRPESAVYHQETTELKPLTVEFTPLIADYNNMTNVTEQIKAPKKVLQKSKEKTSENKTKTVVPEMKLRKKPKTCPRISATRNH